MCLLDEGQIEAIERGGMKAFSGETLRNTMRTIV